MDKQGTNSRRTGAAAGAAFAILGLGGLMSMEQAARGLVFLFGISLRMALETLPSVLLMGWHMLQPCVFGHLRLLDGLLQVFVSWQFVLTLTGA